MSNDCFAGTGPRSTDLGRVSPDDSEYTIGVFYTDFIFIFIFHLNMVLSPLSPLSPPYLHTLFSPEVITPDNIDNTSGKKTPI